MHTLSCRSPTYPPVLRGWTTTGLRFQPSNTKQSSPHHPRTHDRPNPPPCWINRTDPPLKGIGEERAIIGTYKPPRSSHGHFHGQSVVSIVQGTPHASHRQITPLRKPSHEHGGFLDQPRISLPSHRGPRQPVHRIESIRDASTADYIGNSPDRLL